MSAQIFRIRNLQIGSFLFGWDTLGVIMGIINVIMSVEILHLPVGDSIRWTRHPIRDTFTE